MQNSWLHKVTLMIEPQFRRVKASAPATVANVGPGFDCFGLALSKPCDHVEIELMAHSGVCISSILGDGGKLPISVEKNTAGAAVLRFLEHFNVNFGLDIRLQKNLPLKSGLGSSAASSVGALLAVNHLFGNPMSPGEMLPILVESEAIACGARHADNVAPCLFGGFVIIRDLESRDVVSIQVPEDLFCVVIHPHIEVPTRESRRALPNEISLSTMTHQGANMASLIAGLLKKDFGLISRSLTDHVAEPARKSLIPHYDEVRSKALRNGALGFGISGSGPSVFALCHGDDIATSVLKACAGVYSGNNMAADGIKSELIGTGARIIETSPL